MLHLRLRLPVDVFEPVSRLLSDDPTVTNVLTMQDAYVKPPAAS